MSEAAQPMSASNSQPIFGASEMKTGQLPLENLVRVQKAHDVRTLRGCTVCSNLGNSDRMIDVDDEWYHGRCFVMRFGCKALLALPKAKTDRLTLGDLGVRLMKALLNHRTR